MDRVDPGTREVRYMAEWNGRLWAAVGWLHRVLLRWPVQATVCVDCSEDGGATWRHYGNATVLVGSGWFGVAFEVGNQNPAYMTRACCESRGVKLVRMER